MIGKEAGQMLRMVAVLNKESAPFEALSKKIMW